MTPITPFPSHTVVAIGRAANRLVVTHDPLVVRPGLAATYLTVVGEPDRRVMRGAITTITDAARMSVMTTRHRQEGGEHMRKTPTTTQVIFAIGDAAMMVRARLAADGQLCPDDMATIRTLESAQYLAGKADIDRRRRNAIENQGDVPLRLLREERELQQEYAHVALLKAA